MRSGSASHIPLTSAEKFEDKIDPPIHIGYFHVDGATTLIFVVDGANAVNSFVHALNNLLEHGRAT